MPRIEILIYREGDGTVPLRKWLDGLEAEPRVRCLARLVLLEERGSDLRRPHAENIGDGLYELRVKFHRVNLRMLYFFHGRTAAVVSHGFAKERTIPPGEIKVARERMKEFRKDPRRHTFTLEQ
jgi:phage-related protein